MKIADVTINQRITPATLALNSDTDEYGVSWTNVRIGILRPGSTRIWIMPLRIPLRRLQNGRMVWNLRTVRLNHFLNIMNSFADERYNIDREGGEQVVFVGFGH
jgi:hypothetical protein